MKRLLLREKAIIFAIILTGIASGLLIPVSANGLAATSGGREQATNPTPLLKPDNTTQRRLNEAYGKLPLSFEANIGQCDPRVKFISRAGGQTLFLTANDAVLKLGHSGQPGPTGDQLSSFEPDDQRAKAMKTTPSVLRMRLVGAKPTAKVDGLNELPGKSNYFIGNDPTKWRASVSNYAKVQYRSVYPGIDMVYYGNQGRLEYDFNLAPGANPKAIRLAFEGAQRMRIDKDGDLVMNGTGGEVRQHKPHAYQDVDGSRKEIACRYVMKGRNQVVFSLSRYDTRKMLVIDPVLSYSTYLGGSGADTAGGIAVDSAGNAYVAGFTGSADFPTYNPLQPAPPNLGSVVEAFVAKLNSSGTALVYSTYLGGSDVEESLAIAVDSAGRAYVTGYTSSTDFPIVNAVHPTHSPGFTSDAFVTTIDASGSALVYSTFLGGSSPDSGQGITVDSGGNAYVTGSTRSVDFPTMLAMQPNLLGSTDAFVTKFNSGGTLAYSTYLGGNGGETGYGIAVDSLGQAYLAGSTSSPDFPLNNPFQSDFKGRTVFKTTNGGSQWSAINNGVPANVSVSAFAIDSTMTSTVYAGTSGRGVFKSTDNGASWFAASSGLGNAFVDALDISRPNSNVVFAACGNGVFKTTDGGGSWSRTRFGNSASVSIDPLNPSIVYAGNISGISKSTDEGQTWTDTVIRAINSGFTSGVVRDIAIDPVTTSILYVASGGNFLYKSVDAGSTWRLLNNGLFFDGYKSLVIDPTNTSIIYAGANSAAGVFKSTDSGENWVRAFFVPHQSGTTLEIDRGNPSTVYAGTFGANVFKSTDGGTNWIPRKSGLTNSFVLALAIDPANTPTLFAGAATAGEGFIAKLNAAGSSLLYSTYLGGDEADYCAGIAIDSSGNAFATGSTYSTNFPTVNPFQPSHAGSYDGFIAKLNPAGSALVYSTYLGGTYEDDSFGVAVDTRGNAYVTGRTHSLDFPLLNPLPGGAGDLQGNAFVTKVNPAGTGLIYSTFLGGVDPPNGATDQGSAIAVDSGANAYVTGYTNSNQFPTTAGAFQPGSLQPSDAFVSKISTFDTCLQDEASGNLLQLDTTTGNYQFSNCRGLTLSGTAVITRKGCLVTLQVNGPDRRLLARVDTCAKSGSASLQIFSTGTTFTIADRNTANNTCACSN